MKQPDSYDAEALDKALADLVLAAQAARDCYIMGDEAAGRAHFHNAIHQLSLATEQISLLNRR